MTETLRSDQDSAIRLRLELAYDGTLFSGWAKQPGLRTVQGEVERALELVFRQEALAPQLTVAGRTDAGVHAAGQVAHWEIPRAVCQKYSLPTILRRLRGVLKASPDIQLYSLDEAEPGFDARFSAVWRRYEYRIADGATRKDPLQRLRTVSVLPTLDLEKMNAAAAVLIGLHDFASFCKPKDFGTTIRTLHEFSWQRDAEGALVARIVADAFCHSMVRSLVGICAAVAQGRVALDDVQGVLDAQERTSAFSVFPAAGLVLMQVGYPDPTEFDARAEQTRAIRESAEKPA